MLAVTSPDAASMAKTVLRAAAQVTYSLLPSGLNTRPVGSEAMRADLQVWQKSVVRSLNGEDYG